MEDLDLIESLKVAFVIFVDTPSFLKQCLKSFTITESVAG
jgi:hypothetical protein